MKLLAPYTALLLITAPALVAAAPRASEREDGAGKQLVSISAPAGQDRVRIAVSIVSYPGVPERASCRMLFKATNESREPVELSTQLQTYDTYKKELNSWLVPTGTMAPGQSVERIYSCKSASFVALDQRSEYGWPRTCLIDGQPQSPCPVALKVDFNLPQHAQ